MSERRPPIDLAEVRRRLSGAAGPRYWRSLEEIAETEEFQDFLRHEFPENADQWEASGVSRRRFLQLMSASFALAGLAACARQPVEKIVPYTEQPEDLIPGKPLYYATALPWRGYAFGVIAESHEGRPTKIEGNPQHPASLGGTDIFAQASILGLYDPDRSQVVSHAGTISTWETFVNALTPALEGQRRVRGAGLRILTGTVTSPSLAAQLALLLGQMPEARWHRYEAVSGDGARAGARLAFGEDVDCRYQFDRADVVLSLDADFLSNGPASVRYARDFASRRRAVGGQERLSRLYAVESMPGLAGAMADHRLPLPASRIESFSRAVAGALGIEAGAPGDLPPETARFAAAAARDLSGRRGAGLVVAGEFQPPSVHAISHAINHALGNAGSTVVYTDPVEASPVLHAESLRELTVDMDAGKVDVLVLFGGNPVFDAPTDLEFQRRLSKVGMIVRLGLYEDETSEWSHWHVPEVHPLESWGDLRAFDGTASIRQPLIAPLYGGKSANELLAVLLGQSDRSSHDVVKDYWKGQYSGPEFEKFWEKSVHDGVIAGTALPAREPSLRPVLSPAPHAAPGTVPGLEIVYRPDPTVWDGSFANNGWLQELPKPLTRLTWDNAAILSYGTAARLGLEDEEIVELRVRGRSVRAPVWRLPGHPDDVVTVHFGNGRRRVGAVGKGAGFDAYPLRSSAALWSDAGLEIRKTGERLRLAVTHTHNTMEGRALVRSASLPQYRKKPDFVREQGEDPAPGLTLYPGFPPEQYAWGMSIDLGACIGCNACVVACQAENNIPVVGKEQVLRGREMHWIRIDRYYEGGLDNPKATYHEPVLCMHCENAPCEVVCPVGATVHSAEGLNQMIYNRCVGTRYCSNNCPYKVRRFNFLQYSDTKTPTIKLSRNPNVTVRNRGVMEKCSFCVQRIEAVRIETQIADRPIRDGEVRTACQQACPAEAISFGNINDPASRVAKEKAAPLTYGLLTELNTRPRVTYLGKVGNPNPEIGGGS